MYVGGLFAVMIFPLWAELASPILTLGLGIVLLFPGGIDGTTQMFLERESTNKIRAITGFWLGVGVVLVFHGVIFMSANFIVVW